LPAEESADLYTKSDGMIGFLPDGNFPDGGVLAKTVFIDLNTNLTARGGEREYQRLAASKPKSCTSTSDT